MSAEKRTHCIVLTANVNILYKSLSHMPIHSPILFSPKTGFARGFSTPAVPSSSRIHDFVIVFSCGRDTIVTSLLCSVNVRLFATPFATSTNQRHAENTPNERRNSSQRAALQLLSIGDLAVSCTHAQRLPHFTTILTKSHFRSALQPKTPESTARRDVAYREVRI